MYMGTSSQIGPPNIRKIGLSSTLPLMSHSAMSIPLSSVVTKPPKPPPPVNRRYSLCQMRSMYCGSWPMIDSLKSSVTVESRRNLAMFATTTLPPPPELVASPTPDTPSSVSILKNTNDLPRGSGLVTQTFKSVIFIGRPSDRESALTVHVDFQAVKNERT